VSNILTAVVCIPVAFFVGAMLAHIFPDALPAALSADWAKQGAEWLTGIGTLVLATVAVFQDKIRGWFSAPQLDISIETAPPDCMAVPAFLTMEIDGKPRRIEVPSIYLRLLVRNSGNVTAENVEVYARELQQLSDKRWERIRNFPPMNLTWSDIHSNIGGMYFPRIAPGMDKYCDIANILDPTPRLPIKKGLSVEETALTFQLVSRPNHNHHVVGPGEYRLEIFVAASNARPVQHWLRISLSGSWYDDENKMLADGVQIAVD
jgi:hypothetical protein